MQSSNFYDSKASFHELTPTKSLIPLQLSPSGTQHFVLTLFVEQQRGLEYV